MSKFTPTERLAFHLGGIVYGCAIVIGYLLFLFLVYKLE